MTGRRRAIAARARRIPAAACAVLALLAGALACVVVLAGPASAEPSGDVYLVQALAGTTADLVVDGAVVRADAAPKAVVGPVRLSPGPHVLQVRSGATALVSARFAVAAGDSLDVVAHRASDTAMTPVVTVFRNDLSSVGPGKTRLVVSHVAVAEPADIRVDGRPFFRNVAGGESLSLVVPARAYSLDVVATAGSRMILAPVAVTLQPGTLTRVFAYGNPDQKTSDAIVQAIGVPVVGAARPAFVHTGDGGQAADEIVGAGGPSRPAVALGLGAVVLVGVRVGLRRGLRPRR